MTLDQIADWRSIPMGELDHVIPALCDVAKAAQAVDAARDEHDAMGLPELMEISNALAALSTALAVPTPDPKDRP